MTWAAVATVAVGAVSTGVGAYSSNKANKANKSNQEAYNKATQKSEKEARKLFNEFMKGYEDAKAELEGLSLREYIENSVEAIGDEGLRQVYYDARNADWDMAQQLADEATDQNINLFDRALESVGAGSYKEIVEARNQSILGEDLESIYARSRELQAPRQAAGSVRRDLATGEAIQGQRGDRMEFQVAVEEQLKQNERVFNRSRTAIEDDRAAAARQQERAISFLPMLNFADFATTNVVQPYQQDKMRAQLAMLQADAQLATQAMAAAYRAPLAPGQIDTTASQQMQSDGMKAIIGGLTTYNNNQKSQNQGNAKVDIQSRADTNPQPTSQVDKDWL